jgi:hypothetical protein
MNAFADLPILYTDDYSEITKEYLEDAYEELASKVFDFSSLYAPHYMRMLVEAVDELESPAFVLLLPEDATGWVARLHLDRLSRYDRHPDEMRVGNLVPVGEKEQHRLVAQNGAQITLRSDGSLIVELPADSDAPGSLLALPTVEGFTYRVHGRISEVESSYPAVVEAIARHDKSIVLGSAAVTGEGMVDFTFVPGPKGSYLRYRPRRRAKFEVAVEAVLEQVPSRHEPNATS